MKRIDTQTLLPIALLGGLALLSFFLQRLVDMPTVLSDGKQRHDPDYIVDKFTVKRFDETGTLQHYLVAQKMLHFPDDDTTDVIQPHLTTSRPDQPNVITRSDTAKLSGDGKQVTMNDNVVLNRLAMADREALFVHTRELIVLPDDDTGHTDEPVRIVQGRSVLKGTGMTFDNRIREFRLLSEVNGQFERRNK